MGCNDRDFKEGTMDLSKIFRDAMHSMDLCDTITLEDIHIVSRGITGQNYMIKKLEVDAVGGKDLSVETYYENSGYAGYSKITTGSYSNDSRGETFREIVNAVKDHVRKNWENPDLPNDFRDWYRESFPNEFKQTNNLTNANTYG